MDATVPIATAARDLERLLEQLDLGETLTLVSSEGTPLAILVSLKAPRAAESSAEDWDARWDALAHRVSEKWRSDRSALETLAEMRR